MNRTCTICGKTYPATTEYFARTKMTKSGLTARCKVCQTEYMREWYRKNSDKVRAYQIKTRHKKNARIAELEAQLGTYRRGARGGPTESDIVLAKDFEGSFAAMADEVHANARAKGWWDEDRNDGEMIALMHSELSEALEGFRHGNPPDDHIPEFSSVEAELADVVIRIMDMAVARRLRVAEAIVAKHRYNRNRPHKHGGKAF